MKDLKEYKYLKKIFRSFHSFKNSLEYYINEYKYEEFSNADKHFLKGYIFAVYQLCSSLSIAINLKLSHTKNNDNIKNYNNYVTNYLYSGKKDGKYEYLFPIDSDHNKNDFFGFIKKSNKYIEDSVIIYFNSKDVESGNSEYDSIEIYFHDKAVEILELIQELEYYLEHGEFYSTHTEDVVNNFSYNVP